MSFYLDILLKDLISADVWSLIFAGKISKALLDISVVPWIMSVACLLLVYILKFVIFNKASKISLLDLLNDFCIDILLIFAPAISISVATNISPHRLCFILILAMFATIFCVLFRNIYRFKSLSSSEPLWELLILGQGVIMVSYFVIILNM